MEKIYGYSGFIVFWALVLVALVVVHRWLMGRSLVYSELWYFVSYDGENLWL